MMFKTLLKDNLRSWFRARSFWVVLVAALVAPGLTSAWVFTHQKDVDAAAIMLDSNELLEGDLVNITATIVNRMDDPTGPFNATLRVGYFTETSNGGLRFVERKAEEYQLDLAGGASQQIVLNWTTEPGTFIAQVLVDTDDSLAEIEERNNNRFQQFFVQFEPVQVPFTPTTDAGSGTNQTDLALVNVEVGEVYEDDTTVVRFTVRNNGPSEVHNATVHLQVHRASAFGYSPVPSPNLSRTVNLTVGKEQEVAFNWTPRTIGQYAVAGIIEPDNSTTDTNASNNAFVQETFVDRRFLFQEPEPKATAKDFYREVLSTLHLQLLIPLVALFYAGGVLEDDKAKGNLAYVLTRPVPRWMIPTARFCVSFIVAGAALLIGVLLTFLLLLGLPQDAAGFLTWPLFYVLVALFAYSGLFMAFGVTLRRPYVAGLAYVIGLEALIYFGRTTEVNGRPLLQDWVTWFSIDHWMAKAFTGWNPAAPWDLIPDGTALAGLLTVLAVGVVGLVGSGWWMTRRDFEA